LYSSWFGRFKGDTYKLDVVHKRCARVKLGVKNLIPEWIFNMLGWERLQTRYYYLKH